MRNTNPLIGHSLGHTAGKAWEDNSGAGSSFRVRDIKRSLLGGNCSREGLGGAGISGAVGAPVLAVPRVRGR